MKKRTPEDRQDSRRMLRGFLRGSRLFFVLSMVLSALTALMDRSPEEVL